MDFDAIRKGLEAAKGERVVLAPRFPGAGSRNLVEKQVVAAGSGTEASQQMIKEFEDVLDRGNVEKNVDKGKGITSDETAQATTDVPLLETDNVDKLPSVSESDSKRLARLGNEIKERKKKKQVVAREHLAKIKLLDASDSHILGITLEEYAKIKEDTRIVDMLNEML